MSKLRQVDCYVSIVIITTLHLTTILDVYVVVCYEHFLQDSDLQLKVPGCDLTKLKTLPR